MHFAVVPIFVRGRLLDWKAVDRVVPLVGELRVEHLLDPTRHRYLTYASLRVESIGLKKELLPDLYGVHIVGMSPLVFSLSGFERVNGAEYAQSWIVSEAPARRSSREEAIAVRLPFAGVAG